MRLRSGFFAALALALPLLGRAGDIQAGSALEPGKASLTVLGDSTLHRWEAKAASVALEGRLLPGPGGPMERASAGLLRGLTLSVEATQLKSGEGASMDRNMWKALEASKYPQIRFFLLDYKLDGKKVKARGSLEIHGVSKEIEIEGEVLEAGAALQVQGSYEMKMSSFGIKPPVMMLGTVRVADLLKIAFQFQIGGRT